MKYNCHVDKIILLTEHNPEGHHEVPHNKMGQGLRKDRYWFINKEIQSQCRFPVLLDSVQSFDEAFVSFSCSWEIFYNVYLVLNLSSLFFTKHIKSERKRDREKQRDLLRKNPLAIFFLIC